MAAKKSKTPSDVAATNRKVRRDYQVLDEIEAGIELLGTEVKSIRQGHISIEEGFARIENEEAFLLGVHIKPYDHGNVHNHEAVRPRRLLLHKREIRKLIGQVAEKGYTLIPIKVLFKRGFIKVIIGLCKGKHAEDRREDLKRRTADREAQREIANRMKQSS
ncbi:MAG: SsrA-binding protein SmpB [Verrucomicrobiota bacterium]